jgi:hypothetical protein
MSDKIVALTESPSMSIRLYSNTMSNLIPSATLSFAIFLNASAIFAGQWTEVPGVGVNNSGLYGVAVVSANDVWAVGHLQSRALIEHWDGTNWSVAGLQPPPNLLYGVAALSSTDVWAVGQNGTRSLVLHWNGRRWVVVPSPNVGTYDTLQAVSIISHNDAWAVGSSIPDVYILMHWDGTIWSVVNGPPVNSSALLSIKAFATDDVWAVGWKDYDNTHGTFSTLTLHWDGTTWSEIPSPNVSSTTSLSGVDGVAPNDVWAVGYSGFSNVGALTMHWDGTAWTVVPTPTDGGFSAVKAFSATNVFAVGTSFNKPLSTRWDGTQWRVIPTPPVNIPGSLSAISGLDGAVWAVGVQGFRGEATDLIFNWTE